MSTTPPDGPNDETAPAPPVPPAAPAAFAAVTREPWINPTRRTHVAGVGVVAALALLGAGIGIGFAASGNDRPDRHGVFIMPGRGFGYVPGAMYVPHGRYAMLPVPGGPYAGGPSAPAVPSPTPSSTG